MYGVEITMAGHSSLQPHFKPLFDPCLHLWFFISKEILLASSYMVTLILRSSQKTLNQKEVKIQRSRKKMQLQTLNLPQCDHDNMCTLYQKLPLHPPPPTQRPLSPPLPPPAPLLLRFSLLPSQIPRPLLLALILNPLL